MAGRYQKGDQRPNLTFQPYMVLYQPVQDTHMGQSSTFGMVTVQHCRPQVSNV